MCRLFGFRSVVRSQVHRSLIEADNALLYQSNLHPDGWGVAYYQEDVPHIIKSTKAAGSDHLFRQIGGLVTSETVLAHLRKATLGELSIVNTHPFQYGRWVFAHNGNIKGFEKSHRASLLAMVEPQLARFILGDSDSEVIFYIILSLLAQKCPLSSVAVEVSVLSAVVKEAMEKIQDIVGPFSKKVASPKDTYLTFILTNGYTMLGLHGGQPLHYSTYKTRCPERGICPSFSGSCEAPSSGLVNHLILSSEPLKGENIFILLKAGDIIGVDFNMKLFASSLTSG